MLYTLSLLALHAASIHAGYIPVDMSIMKRTPQGAYQCPDGGARINALKQAGATPQDLAIAQLETGCDGTGTSYPLGDGKSGGAANYGQYKNNWDNIRTYCCGIDARLCGTADENYKGEILNSDDKLATDCQHQQLEALGQTDFDRTQRGGSTGTQQDADDYSRAITYIEGAMGGPTNPNPSTTSNTAVNPNPGPNPNPEPVPNPEPSPIPGASNPSTGGDGNQPGGTDIYGSDVCGYGGGPFRGCKTRQEECDHIKTNGQPLPPECGGSANPEGDGSTAASPSINDNPGGTDIYGSDVCGYGGGPYRGCKTQEEACAHIKTNGQPLPPACGGQATGEQPTADQPTTPPPQDPPTDAQPSDHPTINKPVSFLQTGSQITENPDARSGDTHDAQTTQPDPSPTEPQNSEPDPAPQPQSSEGNNSAWYPLAPQKRATGSERRAEVARRRRSRRGGPSSRRRRSMTG